MIRGRKRSVTVTLDVDLLEQMNEARGYEPLSSYINRVLRGAHSPPGEKP